MTSVSGESVHATAPIPMFGSNTFAISSSAVAAATTVSTADQRSREAIRAAATALLDMANVFEPNIGIGAVAWTDSPLTEVTDGPGHGW